MALANEEELVAEDLLVINIRVSDLPLNPNSGHYLQESRPNGIWVLRSKFSGIIDQAVIKVDVLFGMDTVNLRLQQALISLSPQLNDQPKLLVARLSVLRGRVKSRPDTWEALRVREDGKFKIIQISNTYIVTGIGVYKDVINTHGKYLPESEADPLTVNFIGRILDIEKPNVVILTGD